MQLTRQWLDVGGRLQLSMINNIVFAKFELIEDSLILPSSAHKLALPRPENVIVVVIERPLRQLYHELSHCSRTEDCHERPALHSR